MLIFVKFSSSWKLGHVKSKTRSLDQILGKPCVHFRGHSYQPKFVKFCQSGNSYKSRSGLKLVHVGSKTSLLGQILEKPCVHSRGHSFDPKFMKLCQNVNFYKI